MASDGATGDAAVDLAGGGGRGMVGGGGISLVDGRFTLLILGFRLGGAIGVASPDGGFTVSATVSAIVGGVWGVVLEGGGGGRRRGLCGSSPLVVVRRFRFIATGCCVLIPSLVVAKFSSVAEDVARGGGVARVA